jgi:hypothetical protein
MLRVLSSIPGNFLGFLDAKGQGFDFDKRRGFFVSLGVSGSIPATERVF